MGDFADDTRQFIKGEISYGSDYMHQLVPALQPGDRLPSVSGPVFCRGRETTIHFDQMTGNPLLIVFLPSFLSDFAKHSLNTLLDLSSSKVRLSELISITYLTKLLYFSYTLRIFKLTLQSLNPK